MNYLWLDCQSLTPEWKRAATALKGIVKIGAVDADAHKSLGQQYGVQGFPTIKIFGTNKRSPTNYQGGRTADAIVDQAITQLKTIANERLGKRGGGSSGGSGSGSGSGGNDAIELTDSNFEVNYLDFFETFLWCILLYLVNCTRFRRSMACWIQYVSLIMIIIYSLWDRVRIWRTLLFILSRVCLLFINLFLRIADIHEDALMNDTERICISNYTKFQFKKR